MASMITVCPGCSRKGIMSKATGKCFHCNKAAGLTGTPKARKAKVTVRNVGNTSTVTVTEPPPVHPRPSAVPALSARFPIMRKRLVGGRLV